MPCTFVHQVTRHLREMIDSGAARFLFPLDADHAHLGVPMAAWKEKYQHLPPDEVVAALLRDPGLVALYHTAEHLRVTDRNTGEIDSEAKSWLDKRNVIGHFDGRPITILPPQAAGQGAAMPEEYYSYSGFSFLASPRGELYLSFGTKIVVFDIAFDATHEEEFAELENSGADAADPNPAMTRGSESFGIPHHRVARQVSCRKIHEARVLRCFFLPWIVDSK